MYIWDPTLGEVLARRREPTNVTDCYAVAVVNGRAEESTDLAKTSSTVQHVFILQLARLAITFKLFYFKCTKF